MKTPVKRILFFFIVFLDLPGMIVTAQVILEKTYDHSLTVTKSTRRSTNIT